MTRRNDKTMKKISIIISVYNEEEALEEFYRVSCPVFEALSWDYELIFVNDGSADGSLSILRRFAEENSKVKVINFSRNLQHGRRPCMYGRRFAASSGMCGADYRRI